MQQAEFIHNEVSAREHTFAPGLLLQRKCECGQHTIGGRSCNACSKSSFSQPPSTRMTIHSVKRCNACSKSSFSQPAAEVTHPRTEILAGRDLSGVRSHSAAAARNSEAHAPLRGFCSDGIHINGPDAGSGSGSGSGTPPARPQPAPVSPAATCPSDIKVDRVKQADDTDFGKDGPITGWGGYSRMEV